MIETRDLHIVFVTRWGGAHGETAKGSPESNSVSHSSITYYDNNLWNATADLREGGFAIDRRFCENPAVGLNFPHLDCLLEGNQVRFEAWGKPTEYNGTIGIEVFKAAGIHDISPNLYVELNRKCGALIGVRKGNVIEWEHGYATSVPIEHERRNYVRFDPWLTEGQKKFLKTK